MATQNGKAQKWWYLPTIKFLVFDIGVEHVRQPQNKKQALLGSCTQYLAEGISNQLTSDIICASELPGA